MIRMLTQVYLLSLLMSVLAALVSGQCRVKCREMKALAAKFSRLQERIEALEEGKNHAVCDVKDIKWPNGTLPRDCTEIYGLGGRADGVYVIKPRDAPSSVQVLCELSLDGGWTVIMRRFNGSMDFYRKWADYKKGFGSLAGEHWLGNDNIHWLTSQKNYRLQVDMRYWTSKISYYASYDRFSVDSEAAKYKINIHGYRGSVGYDGMSRLNGRSFSTWDRDNDIWSGHCAQYFKGAYWYDNCHPYACLTGVHKVSCEGHDCIEWRNGQALDRVLIKVKHD